MKKLITGMQAFRESYVSTHREFLEHLSQGQDPRVLFITCSDSRIDPNLLTQADVGELFVIRNAGNIIPPYGAANGGEGAAIEYAIHALGIEQVVICGHSHCGAMKGLLQLGKLEAQMPLVYEWLRHAEATRRLVNENYGDHQGEELLEITIAENVLTQIENLKTYPVVHSKLYQGKLKIYGWIYLLETGEVLAYDADNHAYLPPQSQLADSRDTSSPYIKTQAPPVSCELPPTLPEDWKPTKVPARPPGVAPRVAPAAESHAHHSNNGAPARPIQENVVPSWLSPEQAARIYRGSGASR